MIVIGNQTRPKLFDLAIKRPDVLYDKVVEIDERVIIEWPELIQEGAEVSADGHKLVKGLSGDVVRIIKPLGELLEHLMTRTCILIHQICSTETAEVRQKLQALYDEGFRSLAIVFMHSFTFRDHEAETARIAAEIGFEHISQSSDLQAMIRIVPRANSASADAYLTPEIRRYLSQFSKGFVGHLEDETCQVSFMQSDGSLVDHRHFSGLRAILSGPAGGVVGYAQTSYDAEEGTPVVGFDMVRHIIWKAESAETLTFRTTGRYFHRCFSIRRQARARFRDHHGRCYDSEPAARYLHSCSWRWFHAVLPQRTFRSRTRLSWCSSRSGLLP